MELTETLIAIALRVTLNALNDRPDSIAMSTKPPQARKGRRVCVDQVFWSATASGCTRAASSARLEAVRELAKNGGRLTPLFPSSSSLRGLASFVQTLGCIATPAFSEVEDLYVP